MEPFDPACIFCDIVRGNAAADVVWRDDHAVAFLDRSPLFRGHTLVVPANHVVQLSELPLGQVGSYFEAVQRIATVMPGALGATGTFIAMNNIVSQSVAHLHTHVVPRRKGDGLRGFFWPREKYAEGESARFAAALAAALDASPSS